MQQIRQISLLAALLASTTMSAVAAPSFVNTIAVPGSTTDLSGDAGPSGRLGMFSDLYYDPNRDEWWGLADRGAGGGTLPYDTRVERFTVTVNQTTGAISNFQVAQTVKFTDPNNLLGSGSPTNLNGLAPSPTNILGRSFDPEGFVVNPTTGKFLVSDEYGPSVYEFNRDGTLNRVFTTPANLVPRDASNVPNFASDAGNTQGKRVNRGFEGLAITPDGKYAYAMLQSAMLDEGAGNGVYNRIVKFNVATGEAEAQFAYKMEGSNQGRGISSLVALNDHEFLVLERNNRGVGVDSELTPANKKVFKIDITGADDVTNVTLPATGNLPGGKKAVTKSATPFLDLSSQTVAELGGVPEKLEGLTIGPQLNGGKYLIVLGTDNDFSVTQDASSHQYDEYFKPVPGGNTLRIRCDDIGGVAFSGGCVVVNPDGTLTGGVGTPFTGDTAGYTLLPGVLFAYTVDGPTDLVSYQAPIPEPATLAMLGLGLAGLTTLRRRRV